MGGHALTTARSSPAAKLMGLCQCMPTHALTFTKHRQPMFNYYYTMTPHILCSHSPQIHLNNHAMCRFQFLPYSMHRFQQTMSTRFALNVSSSTPGMCRFQQTMSMKLTKHSMFITTHNMPLYILYLHAKEKDMYFWAERIFFAQNMELKKGKNIIFATP